MIFSLIVILGYFPVIYPYASWAIKFLFSSILLSYLGRGTNLTGVPVSRAMRKVASLSGDALSPPTRSALFSAVSVLFPYTVWSR